MAGAGAGDSQHHRRGARLVSVDDVYFAAILFDLGVLRVAAHRKTTEMDQHYFCWALCLRNRSLFLGLIY